MRLCVVLTLSFLMLGAPAHAGSPGFLGTWSVLEAEQSGDYLHGYGSRSSSLYAERVDSAHEITEARDDRHDFFLTWTLESDVVDFFKDARDKKATPPRFRSFFLCLEEPLPSEGGLTIRCAGDNIEVVFSLSLFSENTGILVVEEGIFGSRKKLGVDFPVGTPLFVSRSSAPPAGQITVSASGGNPDFVGGWSEMVEDDRKTSRLVVETSFRKELSHVIVWTEGRSRRQRYLVCAHATRGEEVSRDTISCRPYFPVLAKYPVNELDPDGQVPFALRSDEIAVFGKNYFERKVAK